MNRLLFRFANSPGLIFLAMVGIAIQSSLFNYEPLFLFQPDIVLLAVIWCALKRGLFEGGVLTLILGNIAEIHSSVPQGVFLISYMVVFLMIKGLSRYVLFNKMSAILTITFISSIVWKISGLIVLDSLDASDNMFRHLIIYLIPSALIESLLAYWICPLLEKFDWSTFKDPRARQALEDELNLSEEGL